MLPPINKIFCMSNYFSCIKLKIMKLFHLFITISFNHRYFRFSIRGTNRKTQLQLSRMLDIFICQLISGYFNGPSSLGSGRPKILHTYTRQ